MNKVSLLAYGFPVSLHEGVILMDNFALFVCGIVVTLIAGMGVITSQVFMGYFRYLETERLRQLKKAQAQILELQREQEKENGTVEQTV